MIDKSVPGDRAIRYYPIIDTDDTGRHKVALIPALSDTQLKRDRKPYSSFLGYRKGPDGLPEIVPEEAETVREIYRLFIQGKTVNWIANHLTAKGIPTPRG